MSGNSQVEVKVGYPIVEIFTSIQGEGVNLGKPANFIRFAGCNLNCKWCDTEWKKAKEYLDLETIISRMDSKVELVVLTGGEPTIQKNLMELIRALQKCGHSVAMETNGTNSTKEYWHRGVHISCSPKPENLWSIHKHCLFDELKYVVDDAFECIALRVSDKPTWLQPEGGNMQESWKKALRIQQEWLKHNPNVDIRIGVQLHKIMEVR